ncbi:MAG: pantoate kinase [Candidatus Bathyarchaeales archaeon]
MERKARAFFPSGISSFFEICDQTAEGKPIADLERVGARGGGFAFEKGVKTEVTVKEAEENRIQIYINKKPSPEATTTQAVVEALLQKRDQTFEVIVKHQVEVPIGAGFGSSAAGALGAAFALCKALRLNLTVNQLGCIAHTAEIKCHTGLGTVSPLLIGGCVVTVEPGAPGIAVIDRIPVDSDYRVVAGVFRPWPTKKVLASPKVKKKVNKCGREAVDKILANPSLENFMKTSREFAVESGFATQKVLKLMKLAEKAGAVGAAQNMVGEAVHAVVEVDKVESVFQVFKKVLPRKSILCGKIDYRGLRLLK